MEIKDFSLNMMLLQIRNLTLQKIILMKMEEFIKQFLHKLQKD